MKAAVLKAPGILEVEEVPEPQPGPDEIKVKIAYCGLCGTDPESLAGHFPPFTEPYILGHESSGTIAELGSNVAGYQVGQKVACNFRSFCGGCYYCRNKMEHYCENASHASGGMAEYAVYNKNSVYALPDNVSLEMGALLEPVSVVVNGIDKANVHPGGSVAIFGAGPIGLLMLQLAIRSGAVKTLVSEPVAEKRKLAKELGADVVVDPLKESVEEAGKKFTDSRGFDTVIEATGNLECARQAIFMAAKCGTVLWAAVYRAEQEIGIQPFHIFRNELKIHGTFVSPYTFPRALELLPTLQLKPLVTDIIPLKDVKKAFKLHEGGKPVKILIQP
jgi:(R,R)-butanediol dehydrogenase/meso-butanediol dehydrogenase/diacetyl reductase/L-iditol 2-dehydrogenase